MNPCRLITLSRHPASHEPSEAFNPAGHLAGLGRWMSQLGRAPSTIRAYTILLAAYFRHLESKGWTTPGEAWLCWETSPQSRRMTGTALRLFAEFCEEFQLTKEPLWKPKRLPPRTPPAPQPVTFSVVQNVLRASKKRYPGLSGESFRGWVLLVWATGLRRSEAAALRPCDFQNDRSWLIKVKGKGGRSRVVPVPQGLAKVLLSRVAKDSKTLWPGERVEVLRGDELARMWARSVECAALPRTRFHRLRHSRLTRWAQEKSPWEYSALSGQVDLNSSRYYVSISPSTGPGIPHRAK